MVLLILILWVGYDFHTAQSVPLERETIWVTFLHVVWYDKAAAGPARNVSSQRAAQKHCCVCLLFTCAHYPPEPEKRAFWVLRVTTDCLSAQCHFSLTLLSKPVDLSTG